jgi:hypothetical protein
MNTRTWMTLPLAACLALTILACNLGSPGFDTLPSGATQPPAPAATASAQDPATATAALGDEELSEGEVVEILRTSLAAFPWRITQSVTVKETGQTSTSLMEAQSGTRGYARSQETAGGVPFTVESIVYDSTVYVKMTGAGMAESYGLVEGQWSVVAPDSVLMPQLAQGSGDPGAMADTMITEFAALKGEAGVEELVFELVGSEKVNGVATNIYEATGPTMTYRIWIGADGRFHKSTLDIAAATRTIVIEYDPGINIEPPIP